jgi:hypothetical protein
MSDSVTLGQFEIHGAELLKAGVKGARAHIFIRNLDRDSEGRLPGPVGLTEMGVSLSVEDSDLAVRLVDLFQEWCIYGDWKEYPKITLVMMVGE